MKNAVAAEKVKLAALKKAWDSDKALLANQTKKLTALAKNKTKAGKAAHTKLKAVCANLTKKIVADKLAHDTLDKKIKATVASKNYTGANTKWQKATSARQKAGGKPTVPKGKKAWPVVQKYVASNLPLYKTLPTDLSGYNMK